MRKIIIAIDGENGRPLGNGKFAPYDTKSIDKEIQTNLIQPFF